jgi:hypothetical protein
MVNIATQPDDVPTSIAALLSPRSAAVLRGLGRTLAFELVRVGDGSAPVLRVRRITKMPIELVMDLVDDGSRDLELSARRVGQ